MIKHMAGSKNRNKVSLISRCTISLIICIMFMYGVALATPVIELKLLSEPVTDVRSFTATLEVTVNDLSFYKEDMFLSYHVYSSYQLKEESEALRYENVRIPIVLNADGKATISIPVDVSDLSQNQLLIQYDIVDTVDLFWFTSNKNVEFTGASTSISYSWWSALFRPIVNIVHETPVLLIINIVIFILTLFTVSFIIRRRLLKF